MWSGSYRSAPRKQDNMEVCAIINLKKRLRMNTFCGKNIFKCQEWRSRYFSIYCPKISSNFHSFHLLLVFSQYPIYVTISNLFLFISFVQPPSFTWSSPIWRPKRPTHCSTRMPASTRRSATTGTIHTSSRFITISAHFCHTLIMKLRPWIPADFVTISCKRMKWFWSEDRTTVSSHHGNRGNEQTKSVT